MAKSSILLCVVYVSINFALLATLLAPAEASPRVTSNTPAKLTNNDFSSGGGSGESECDEKFHSNKELVVALSTGWYDNGSRCGKLIRITANNGRKVVAKVVDECDENRDDCPDNIVDGSDAVWKALRLDIDIGVVSVHWAMV